MQLHFLVFLILLHEFWSLTWIDRLFTLLYFVLNFLNSFYNFCGLFYLYPWELCLFLKYFFSLFFFIHFPVFLTQVYRFYRNFLVFHFFICFQHFCFMQLHFLLNFIDYFSRKCYLWLQLNSCIHFSRLLTSFFLQLSCVINFGIEEVVCFQIFFVRYLLFYIHCFGFFDTSL